MEQLLLQLGIGVGSNAVYDIVKLFLNNAADKGTSSSDDLRKELVSRLSLIGQEVKADKIISFLAENGDIEISNTKIVSNKSILMNSNNESSLTFGDNSTSSTPGTQIQSGSGAFIKIQGNAAIQQDEQGNISFHAK